MRRISIIVGVLLTVTSAVAYQKGSGWQNFEYVGTQLKVNLAQPDALVRTSSLTELPKDVLKIPVAHDVLSEDLLFYYQLDEDRLGLNGAIKRIAYEHKLSWNDQLLASVLDEPAELAFWRDGKGALRHYALVIERNALAKVLEQAAKAALKDEQLKKAGELTTKAGKATVLALTLNPRRTLLLISQGDKLVVLSDPGLLMDKKNKMVTASEVAAADWLDNNDVLSNKFALPASKTGHSLAVNAATLAFGYSSFFPALKGLRFDYNGTWSSALWLDKNQTTYGQNSLWQAAPANPSACMALPVDWRVAQKIAGTTVPSSLPSAEVLAAFERDALVCWYNESKLYAPVFIARLNKTAIERDNLLNNLANWALGKTEQSSKEGVSRWQANHAAIGAREQYVVFSPDAALVDKVLDTVAHNFPSVADQAATSDHTIALFTPQPLAEMAQREMLETLQRSGDNNLVNAAQTHLPAKMQALAKYPSYKLELAQTVAGQEWQKVEWVSK